MGRPHAGPTDPLRVLSRQRIRKVIVNFWDPVLEKLWSSGPRHAVRRQGDRLRSGGPGADKQNGGPDTDHLYGDEQPDVMDGNGGEQDDVAEDKTEDAPEGDLVKG